MKSLPFNTFAKYCVSLYEIEKIQNVFWIMREQKAIDKYNTINLKGEECSEYRPAENAKEWGIFSKVSDVSDTHSIFITMTTINKFKTLGHKIKAEQQIFANRNTEMLKRNEVFGKGGVSEDIPLAIYCPSHFLVSIHGDEKSIAAFVNPTEKGNDLINKILFEESINEPIIENKTRYEKG